MFKVKFQIVSHGVVEVEALAGSTEFRFAFTDSAGDPIPDLIASLVVVATSIEGSRTVRFLEEPGFLNVELTKRAEDEVSLKMHRDSKIEFAYTGKVEKILTAFRRGLQGLQSQTLSTNLWPFRFPDSALVKLQEICKREIF